MYDTIIFINQQSIQLSITDQFEIHCYTMPEQSQINNYGFENNTISLNIYKSLY